MEPKETLDNLTSARSQHLRWGIFALLILLQIFASLFTHMNLGTLIILMGIAAAVNSLIAWVAPRFAAKAAPAMRARTLIFLLYSRIAIDLLLLLAAIRVTGGIESPFLLLLLVYLFRLDMQAGPQVGLIASLSALLALGINGLLELYRVLPHLN